MEPCAAMAGITWIVLSLEIPGMAVIALAFAHAIVRGMQHFVLRRENACERLRNCAGKALLPGLEFPVEADIVRTVSIEGMGGAGPGRQYSTTRKEIMDNIWQRFHQILSFSPT